MTTPLWLPEMVFVAAYADEDDWDRALYRLFRSCFLDGETRFRGQKVIVLNRFDELGRHQGFRHLTTVGVEPNRKRDWPRCERLPWIKAIIEADEADVRTWRQDQGSIAIALPDFSYMVCLREMSRRDAVFLLSAFPKSKSSGRVKIRAEYERCKTQPLPPIPTK